MASLGDGDWVEAMALCWAAAMVAELGLKREKRMASCSVVCLVAEKEIRVVVDSALVGAGEMAVQSV